MRTAPPPERIGVVPEPLVLGPEALRAHAGEEGGVVVDALGAGHDFLPAHEEVVGVCEGGVAGGGVRVEGAEGAGELVDGVEVRVVLREDDSAEGFFLGGAGGRGVSGGVAAVGEMGREGWRDEEMVGGTLTRCRNAARRRRCRLRIGALWLPRR